VWHRLPSPVHPDVVGRAGLSQPAAYWMQNIMLRRRAGTDAPYLHHRQHRDVPCPACYIADGPSARRVKNEALPFSPRARSLRRPAGCGSLRHNRQGCLCQHDNPVTENLWMHHHLGNR